MIKRLLLGLICIMLIGCNTKGNDEGMMEVSNNVEAIFTVRILVESVDALADYSEDGEILGKVYRSDILKVFEVIADSDKEWFKVELETGETAWIAGWLCKKVVYLVENGYEGEIHNLAYTENETLEVRSEYALESEAVGQIRSYENHEIYETYIDDDNNAWYKVMPELGVVGWIPGWECEEIADSLNYRITTKGQMFEVSKDSEDMVLDVLLSEEFTLDSLLELFDSEYTIDNNEKYKVYSLENGVLIALDDYDRLSVVIDNTQISKKQEMHADILSSPGEEIIITYTASFDYYMIIVNPETREILYNCKLDYLDILGSTVEVSFDGVESKLEVESSNDEESTKKVYKVIDDVFFKISGE